MVDVIPWASVLSALLGVAAGFGLTTLRDWSKAKKQRAALYAAARAEIDSNLLIIGRNQTRLEGEDEVRDQGRSMVEPLEPLRTGMWEMIRLVPPGGGESEFVLTAIAQLHDEVERQNLLISGRDAYRMNNESMDNFSRRMGIWSKLIQERNPKLENALRSARAVLVEHPPPELLQHSEPTESGRRG